MDSYILALAAFGALVLLTAWLPMVLKELPLSLPIACVAIGAAIYGFFDVPGPQPDPRAHPKVAERLTEIVVIVSLMGAGLKIDRALGWRSWMPTWRLLALAMPLTIGALFLLGQSLLGLGAAAALLLAASLAPTDPVLASDVQVGDPGEGEEDEARFALTSEAGLNDALAFPFVHGAIILAALAAGGAAPEGSAGETGAAGAPLLGWLQYAVLYKLAVGVAAGWAVGFALGWLTFHLPNRAKLSRTGDGFVALGVTGLSYGLTEMLGGYGFLAVFVSALALRSTERGSDYHQKLHDFAEELERLLMMVLLVMFGGALVTGLLAPVDWGVVFFAVVAVFVIRPLMGWLSLLGARGSWEERSVIAFFGIRGIGTFYYVAYGMTHANVPGGDTVWAAASLVVVISIFLHGTTVTPVMNWLDRRHGRPTAAEKEGEKEEGGTDREDEPREDVRAPA